MIIVATILFGYAALLSGTAPAVLRGSRWVVRAPRLGIALWQALSVSWLASVALGGLALLTPWLLDVLPGQPAPVVAGAAGGFSGPIGLAVAIAGATIVLGSVARTGYALANQLMLAVRVRRQHGAALALVGQPSPELGAVIVDNDSPAAYCLAGPGRHQVVVTSAAVRLLAKRELRVVLAHERAHLRERHHCMLAIANGLYRAYPLIPLFALARNEIAVLVEMAADDAAARRHDGPTLAAALVRLARASAPAAALGASDRSVVRRIDRMLRPLPPLRLPARTAGAAAAFGAVIFPLVVACIPLVVLSLLLAAVFSA